MDNNKGQTIFLSVIGIATLLVAIIGATFAWFSVNVTGNDKASSIIVTTAVLGSITFTDGSVIDLSNIRPEHSPQASKTFTIANTQDNLSKAIEYYVTIDVQSNTLSPKVNNGTGNYFVHQLTGSACGSGSTCGTNAALGVDTLINSGEVAVPSTIGETQIGGTGKIVAVSTHTYTYKIQFKDSGSNQNQAQGTSFYGKLQVHTTDTGSSS